MKKATSASLHHKPCASIVVARRAKVRPEAERRPATRQREGADPERGRIGGGRIVATGTPSEIKSCPQSVIGRYI